MYKELIEEISNLDKIGKKAVCASFADLFLKFYLDYCEKNSCKKLKQLILIVDLIWESIFFDEFINYSIKSSDFLCKVSKNDYYYKLGTLSIEGIKVVINYFISETNSLITELFQILQDFKEYIDQEVFQSRFSELNQRKYFTKILIEGIEQNINYLIKNQPLNQNKIEYCRKKSKKFIEDLKHVQTF